MKGLNQKKLAALCGLSPNWLGKIEANKVIPTEKVLKLIARGLMLPDNYFLNRQPDLDAGTAHRIVIEMDIPKDFRLDEERLDQIREAMVDAGNHIINTIKKIDKNA